MKIYSIEQLNIKTYQDKLNKSFFKITKKHTNALRSINNRRYIANYFYGDNWNIEGKKSVNFSVDNLSKLKKLTSKTNSLRRWLNESFIKKNLTLLLI